jgi:hypothetical protein
MVTAQRALEALNHREAFGFNYDPSHFGYQHVAYVDFIRDFKDRIYHVHMKDVYWSSTPQKSGVFGGHLNFGDYRRYWDFRSLGHGKINFEEIIRALNNIDYQGPLSIEWEDSGMDRFHGAKEACEFTKRTDFPPSERAFDRPSTRREGLEVTSKRLFDPQRARGTHKVLTGDKQDRISEARNFLVSLCSSLCVPPCLCELFCYKEQLCLHLTIGQPLAHQQAERAGL